MKKSKHNAKNLHVHAIPVVFALLALTFLVAGMMSLAGGKTAYKELGHALVRRSVTLTTGSDGSLHLGLARAANPTQDTPVTTVQTAADAQIGQSITLQQTVDQTVTTSDY